MPIDCMYKDVVPVGLLEHATSLLMTGALLPNDVQVPPPPRDTP